jgi:protein-histidine pros-kinase
MPDAQERCPLSSEPHSPDPPADAAHALHWVEGDRDLVDDLVSTFVADYLERLDMLRVAIASQHSESARREAHSLKGVLSGFGARTARQLAEAIEHHSRSGRFDEARSLFLSFEVELHRVVAYFKAAQWSEALNVALRHRLCALEAPHPHSTHP